MRFTFFILCLFLSFGAIAQLQPDGTFSKAYLEGERKKIQDEIHENEQQLEALKKNKNATVGQLRLLQNKLNQRQNLIANINNQMSYIDRTIQSSSKEVLTLKQKLEQEKIRYAQSIRYAYETRSSYDMLAYVFSSRNFNDAMRRMKYLKKFRDFRKAQVEEIRITQGQLKQKIGVLSAEKQEKDQLLNAEVQQKQVLLAESGEANQRIKDLEAQSGEILKKIKKNKEATARINNYIKLQIEKEMAAAAKKAEEAAKLRAASEPKTTPVATTTTGKSPELTRVNNVAKPKISREAPELYLTPSDVALAADFEGNRGKLYWPVEKGYIIDHFGQHPHPAQPKVMVDNAGVDIQTAENANVRAVFEGVVTNIFSVGGSNAQVVMIKHGNYFTVYNGVANVSVRKDQQVSVKQAIGQVVNNDENIPTINFQVWKSMGKGSPVKLNPEQWIGRVR